MRKLTRKQILARLFIGFFAVASIFYESSSVWSADYGTYTINNGAANTLTEAGITPANKSENKLDVSIITGTGSIADIYGGYSDATDDVCSNTVHIKSSEGSGIALTNVYGGYTYKSGDASYNEVNISSSTVNQSVFGGVTGFATDGAEEINYGNAIGNKVNISSSTVALYVFGGIASDTGDASYNEVTVASSTVKKMIYGGYAYGAGNAEGNKIAVINNSSLNSTVYAGRSFNTGDATSNEITVDNSKTKALYAGYSKIGSSTLNLINIDNSSATTIYGGYVSNTGNADENTLNIFNSSLSGSAYAGRTATGSANLNTVSIASSSVSTSIYSGYVYTLGDASKNKAIIASSTINNSIYGGYVNGSGNASENEVTVASSSISSVYGGYLNNSGDATDNKVSVVNSKVTSSVYGGRAANGNSFQNNTYVASSTVVSYSYGGYVNGRGDAANNKIEIIDSHLDNSAIGGDVEIEGNAVNNEVITNNSIIKGNVHGGWLASGTAINNVVNIDNSVIEKSVYGGYLSYGISADNTVNISSSTVNTSVYGSYSSSGNSSENTVDIGSSTINTSVYGGYSTKGSCNNIVDVTNSIVNNSVFGGHSSSGSSTYNIVDIASSTVNVSIYGAEITSSGDAENNSVNITDTTVVKEIYGAYTSYYSGTKGNAIENEVYISNSKIKSKVYGGLTGVKGDAIGNKITIASSTVDGRVYAGSSGLYLSTLGDAIDNHLLVTDSKMSAEIYGGLVFGGTSTQNIVDVSSSTVSIIYGGYIGSGGVLLDNEVNIECSKTGTVYGGIAYSKGNAEHNIVNIASSTTNNVYGGYSANGNTSRNIVNIYDNTSSPNVYGGYSKNDYSIQNVVNISSGSVKTDVYGGYALTSGDTFENSADIADSIVGRNVYGGWNSNGVSEQNTVEISNSSIGGNVFGGFVYNGSSTQNIVNISISSLNGNAYGGVASTTGDAVGNEITITDSTVNQSVHGGYAVNGDTTHNVVNIASATLKQSVFGGKTTTGSASQNIINISNSSVSYDVYGGYSSSGKTNNNTICIENGAVIDGNVFGGSDTDKTGNKLIISGEGNIIGGITGNFESLSLDASTVHAGDTMLALTTDTAFDINVNKIETTDVNLSDGESITLISSTANNTFNGNIVYKVNGKQTFDTGSGKYISNFASEDSDRVVHIKEYSYVKDDNDLKLCNKEFISAIYKGKDADGNLQNLGDADKPEIVIDSAPGVSKIYGSFSELPGTIAGGGAAITLSAAELDLSDADIIGSCNIADPTNIDVTNNTLNVEANGIKVKNIEGFENVNLKMAAEDTANLIVNSINLDYANINTEFSEGFIGTKSIISSDNAISQNSTTYRINGETLTGDRKYHMAKANDTNVTIGTYKYNTSDSNVISITGDSLVAGVYRNGSQQLSADDNTLVVDSAIASSYNDVYGAYSADGSDATGATVKLSEKLDAENLTIHSGYSTNTGADTKTGNTFEIAAAGAGSKVKEVRGFEKYSISLAPDMPADTSMLHAVSINLDNASVETELSNGFNGTKSIISSDNAISQNSTTYKINGEILTGDRKYHMAKANETNVTIGTYKYNTSDANAISITGDALIAGIYRNGSQQLSAAGSTLVVDSAIASSYNDVYGAYSADGSDATGATVRLSEKLDAENLTIHSGYSTNTGADTKTGNTLIVEKSGNRVKGADGFSTIQFSTDSLVDSGNSVLTTSDKVDLDGVAVNVDMEDVVLNKGEKIVLLDNTENKASKLLIDGMEGDKQSAKENKDYVSITRIGYADETDKVAVEHKESVAAGKYVDENNRSLGKDKLILGSSATNSKSESVRGAAEPVISEFEDIYGVYSSGGVALGGATVEIVSAVDYGNTIIHGGYNTAQGLTAVGNTLNVKALNAKVKGITHFENMGFVLPPETRNGSTMLKVTETVDMSPTKKVDVDAVQAVMLRAGDSVNLITGEAGIVNFGNQQINISGLTDKVAEVGIYDKSLVLSVESEKQNQNTKAPVEGIAAAMANITAANDLTSNRLSENMITVAANGIGGNFAAMNGGHNKFNTGSYVEANSWNLGFGVGKKGLLKNNPDSTVGLFVQYGRSTFSTHNDDFRGDGNSRLLGAGIMVHHEGSGRFYHLGNLYAGKINTTWNSIAGGYDDSAPYFGFTIGVGSKHNVGSNRVMDVYGRYSFNHVGAMEGNLGGYSYHFNSADSSNLRLGLRMDYLKKNGSKAYWGLAWEHEFAGDCGAYMNLGPTESPSLNGNTGIVEVGYEWNQGNWNYNLNAEGNFGKREGVVGSFNVNYNFD